MYSAIPAKTTTPSASAVINPVASVPAADEVAAVAVVVGVLVMEIVREVTFGRSVSMDDKTLDAGP